MYFNQIFEFMNCNILRQINIIIIALYYFNWHKCIFIIDYQDYYTNAHTYDELLVVIITSCNVHRITSASERCKKKKNELLIKIDCSTKMGCASLHQNLNYVTTYTIAEYINIRMYIICWYYYFLIILLQRVIIYV